VASVSRATSIAVSAAIATCAVSIGVGPALAKPVPAAPPVTPSGWSITPAGRSITADSGPGLAGPWGVAVAPDGVHALVTSSGQAAQIESVEVFDIAHFNRTDIEAYDGATGASVFYGLVYSPDGKRAWAAGGGQQVVHSYDVAGDGSLTASGDIPAGFFAAGLAYGRTPLGDRLYVANNLGGDPFTTGPYEDPPGHEVTVIDPATSQKTTTIDLGTPLQPLGVTFERNGLKAYVTNWAGRSVSVIDTATERKVADILLSSPERVLKADHPSGIAANPVRDEVYTANANSDTVSVIDTRTDRVTANLDVSLVPGAAKGALPEGLAVSPDGGTLYVAEAGENAIAVVDLERRRVKGFIPTAWYPSSVAVTPDGGRIVIANTNGTGAGPNRCGPSSPLPAEECDDAGDQYSGSMIKGTVQVVDLPRGHALDRRLEDWTRRVIANNDALARRWRKPRALERIRHVIYVIKENRTYDQVFGSLGKGNGDPELTIFGDRSAPNHRALARRFVTLDNFYVDAEVSADGHPWSTQATATDYVDKTWPFDYAAAFYRSYNQEFVPLDQQFASEPLASDPSVPRSAAAATVGYIWDDAYDHGVSFRDYGEGTPWADPSNCGSGRVFSDLTRLHSRFGEHVDPRFPGWNMQCSDHAVREPEWEREFRQYERDGNLPGLSIVYFPNDHTQGTSTGEATPESYMADNDLAVGKMVDAVSHSRYWKSTVIITVEDDAQDGPDHVDAHRSPTLVISPYTQYARVDSTHYDTAAALATIEDLLGMAPMSVFDQRATRMWASFHDRPNLRPYQAITPAVVPFGAPGFPTNGADAPLARASDQQDFSVPDRVDEAILNAATWKSVKGARSKMPAPRHSLVMAPGAPGADADEAEREGTDTDG
jgi:YVTN family beta-propeller protein